MDKKTILIGVAVAVAAMVAISAFKVSGDRPGQTWDSAIAWTDPTITADEVAAKGKPIFLYFHTEWCTFCRKMKQETFTDERVQKNLGQFFVNIRINPEVEGMVNFLGTQYSYADLARSLGVTGYPASFFFDETGKLLGGQPGFLDKDQMGDLTQYIGGRYYRDYKFSEFLNLPPDQKTR